MTSLAIVPPLAKEVKGKKKFDVSTSFVDSSTVSNKVIPVVIDNGSSYRIILKSESNISLESYKRTLFTSGGNVAKIVQRQCIFFNVVYEYRAPNPSAIC